MDKINFNRVNFYDNKKDQIDDIKAEIIEEPMKVKPTKVKPIKVVIFNNYNISCACWILFFRYGNYAL